MNKAFILVLVAMLAVASAKPQVNFVDNNPPPNGVNFVDGQGQVNFVDGQSQVNFVDSQAGQPRGGE